MFRDPYTQRLHVDAYGGDGDSDYAPQRDYGPYFPDSMRWIMFKFDFVLEQHNVGSDGKTWQVVPADGGKWRKATPEEVSMWLRLIDYQERLAKLRGVIGDAQIAAAQVR